ncbi:hypothetical protein CHI09_08185 [Shouchella clausii]|nr:hypothetical protein CHI09_08185 [Shouchella clausii]
MRHKTSPSHSVAFPLNLNSIFNNTFKNEDYFTMPKAPFFHLLRVLVELFLLLFYDKTKHLMARVKVGWMMKKGIWIPIVFLIVLGGGVAMAFALNGSDDIALKDDFTSSFLDPEVETDEGFHYFQSEKNNFSMWFPAGYYIEDDPTLYESKDHFEFLDFYEDQRRLNENGFSGFIQLKYRDNMTDHRAHLQLNRLLDDLSYDNQYEKLQTEETIIYYGSSYLTLEDKKGVIYDPETHPANRYFALVQSLDYKQFIVVKYGIFCKNEKDCAINNEQESRFFDTIIRSIRFQK